MKKYIWAFKNNVGEISFEHANSLVEAQNSANFIKREEKTKVYEVDFDDLEPLYPPWQKRD